MQFSKSVIGAGTIHSITMMASVLQNKRIPWGKKGRDVSAPILVPYRRPNFHVRSGKCGQNPHSSEGYDRP